MQWFTHVLDYLRYISEDIRGLEILKYEPEDERFCLETWLDWHINQYSRHESVFEAKEVASHTFWL